MIERLSADDLLAIGQVELGPGVQPDRASLETAAREPMRTHHGRDRYPGLHVKAAALMMAMLRVRPYPRGNAAIALLATVVFLNLNGFDVDAEDEELVALVAVAAAGASTVLQVASALEGITVGLRARVP